MPSSLLFSCLLLLPQQPPAPDTTTPVGGRVIGQLVTTALDPSANAKTRVAAALRLAADPTLGGVPALVAKLAHDADPAEQGRAILALTAMGRVVTLPLEAAMASDDEVLRRNATAVLATLDDPRATPTLRATAVTDASDHVRRVAASALDAQGNGGDAATAFVEQAMHYLDRGGDAVSQGPLWEMRDGALLAIDVPDHLRAFRLGLKMARAAVRLAPQSENARSAYTRALRAEASALDEGPDADDATIGRIAVLRAQATDVARERPTIAAATNLGGTAMVGHAAPAAASLAPLHLQVARDREIVVQLVGARYRNVSAARVVQGSLALATRSLTASLGVDVAAMRELRVRASADAPLGFYRIEALEDGRPRYLLPIALEVTAETTTACVAGPASTATARRPMTEPVATMRAYRPGAAVPLDPALEAAKSGRHAAREYVPPTAITGTRDFAKVPGDTPTPYVSVVIPESLGSIGGVVELRGAQLPCGTSGDRIAVLLGSIPLEVLESTATHVKAKLPSFTTVGSLRAVRASDGATVTAAQSYQVSTFQPFDHFEAGATAESPTNAYLLALAAQHAGAADDAETSDRYRTRVEATFAAYGMTVVDVVQGATRGVAMQNDTALIVALAAQPGLDDAAAPAAVWRAQEAPGVEGDSAFVGILAGAAQARDANRRVWLTGHGVGGTLARIVALRLQLRGVEVQGVITFGAPAFGSEGPPPTFAAAFDGAFGTGAGARARNIVDVVHVGEAGAHVPPFAVDVETGFRATALGTSFAALWPRLDPNPR